MKTLEQKYFDVNWFGFKPNLLFVAKEKSHLTEKSNQQRGEQV
jgi:hypothetical protein